MEKTECVELTFVVQIGFATHHCFFIMTCLSTRYNYCLNASAMKWWMAFGFSPGIESRKKEGQPKMLPWWMGFLRG